MARNPRLVQLFIRSRLVLVRAYFWYLYFWYFRSDVRTLRRQLTKGKSANSTCFIFSTKNRPDFTKQSLTSIEKSKDFDLIWLDASTQDEALSLFKDYQPRNFNIVGRLPQVTGGPDVAILLGLHTALRGSYSHIGLIENDVVFSGDWLPTLKELFNIDVSEVKATEVGGASLRNYEARNLIIKNKFSYAWNLGAGMILFSRAGLKKVLSGYGFASSQELLDFYQKHFGVDLSKQVDPLFPEAFKINHYVGGDVKFCYNLWKNDLACVASIPSLAHNIDVHTPELYL